MGRFKMIRDGDRVAVAVRRSDTREIVVRPLPVNRRFPLAMLMDVCRDYIAATHRRVTFEYALMDGVNDSDEQAGQLADLIQGMLAHVNLIPLNPTPASPYSGSSHQRVKAFEAVLLERGISATVRLRRGIDIQAGCGQLRAQFVSAVHS